MKRLAAIVGMMVLLLVVMSGTALAAATAESESNDSIETATAISTNTSVTGKLSSGSDKDWYTFDLLSDGVIQISFDHPVIASTSSYWVVCLYDELGLDLYDELYVTGKDNVVGEEIGLPAGRYCLKITYANSYSDNTYTLRVKYTKSSVWEKELNDSRDEATPIALNTTYSGSLMELNDRDWYMFDLLNDGVVQISFDHPVIASTSSYWVVCLYDELGLDLYDELYVTGKDNVVGEEIGLPAGRYCLKITYANSYSDNTYTLRVKYTKSSVWEKELNDSCDEATPIALNTTYSGSLMESNDRDWYMFDLLNDGVVQISFDHPVIASTSSYWVVCLYDELGLDCYDELYVTGKDNVVGEEIGLPAGRYCLKITDANRYSDSTYKLKVKYTKSSVWEKELNDSCDEATPIALNTNYYGSLMESTDKDWYSFDLPSDDVIQLSFEHPVLSSTSTYWHVVLYDELGLDALDDFYVKGNVNLVSTEIGLQAGRYNVKITDSNYYSSATYIFRIKAYGSPVTLTFNANSSATGVPSPITKKLNTVITIPSSSLTRTGYKFLGWSLDNNASAAQYKAGDSFTMDANRILYAVWTPNYITEQPSSVTVSVGDTATFSVATVGSGLKYQWQAKAPGASSWSNSTQSGATTKKLSVATTVNHNGYLYRCVVSDSSGKKCYSSGATLTIVPKITAQPSDKSVAVGNKATFTVSAEGKATLKYQWQAQAPGSSSWSNSTQSGATTKTLSVSTNVNHNGYQYRCVVTDGNGKVTYSSAATLTITPKITTQPESKSVAVGNTATFTVTADGKATLKYQWQAKAPSSNTWSNSTQSGAKTKTLSVATIENHNGYQYRCVVTDGNGKVAYSSAATLTIVPKIMKQPVSTSATVGSKATFMVTANGKATLKYQWQAKAPGSNTWSNSTQSGATTNTLSVSTTANHNGYQYRCVVTDGNGKKSYSSAATLYVLQFTSQPSSKSVSAGTKVSFNIAATGLGTLTYQWQYKTLGSSTWKNSSQSGATTATLTITTTSNHNGYQYRCVVTDGTSKKIYSSAAKLTVN